MVVSFAQSSIREQRPVSRFGPLDDLPRRIARLEDMDPSAVGRHIGLEADTAATLLERARLSQALSFAAATTSGVPKESLERALRFLIHPADKRIAITDVVPAHGPVMSGRPFALRVHFAAAALNPPRLASVRVEWSGEPFVHEVLLTAEDASSGYVDVVFGADQTLPVGAATFAVSLYNALGAMSRFTTTCAVLPSNPFALQVGPNGSFVTGTWSARGVRNGDAYDTGIAVTLFNGGTSAVTVQQGFHWTFWDGGVGGSLVEQGNGAFPGGTITVPGEGTWGGWISFHSPDGSGIFKKYQDREDMTIEIVMTRTNGGTVWGTITARTMFAFRHQYHRSSRRGFHRAGMVRPGRRSRADQNHLRAPRPHVQHRRPLHPSCPGGWLRDYRQLRRVSPSARRLVWPEHEHQHRRVHRAGDQRRRRRGWH